jgi:hypothetical protein
MRVIDLHTSEFSAVFRRYAVLTLKSFRNPVFHSEIDLNKTLLYAA